MAVDKSQIQVNNIVGESDQPVLISYGATVSSGSIFSCLGGVTAAGVITATSFSGNGSGLTNIPVAQTGVVIGTILIA